jgi:urea transporter
LKKIKQYSSLLLNSTLNSYTSVFFSDNKLFALILIGVTFFNINAGLSGFIAVVFSNLLAYLMGYNEVTIRKGLYGFNSLLVGVGIGIMYIPGTAFFTLLIFSAMLTLFIAIAMEGIIGKYGLPYLSVPFLLAIWLILVATSRFQALTLSESGIYVLNELYSVGGEDFVDKYHQLNNLGIPLSFEIYFKSLGAIFFQYNMIAGMLIALGILIYSRISFTLSLLGFYTAYFFYMLIGVNINEMSYNYIGFNFILTAIAIGGFFIVPSKASYFWVIVITPLIAIVTSGSEKIFWIFQLSIYSLPFNVVVLLFLYVLKFRVRQTLRIEEVVYQQNSPEKNFYSQLNTKKRFKNTYYFPVSLPFWGEWTVMQGHDGGITHKGEWKYAWDFIIKDFHEKAFDNYGMQKKDYFCFEKAVIAPADGEIVEIINNIPDNEIGEVNVNDNWGNTLIIKHAPMLYSKLSHLRVDSLKVKKGDLVKRGDLVALCGNSGRSPEPHLHFQLQTLPQIDAKTIDFPISYYIKKKNDNFEFCQFEKPREGETVLNIEKNILLTEAYKFIPGRKFKFLVNDSESESEEEIEWTVEVDSYNNSYLLCSKTGSKAFFTNDGNIHYFRHFEGDKDSLLFFFFMASYKVMMGFYKKLVLDDQYPTHLVNNPFLLILQDFIAPFFMFVRSDYSLTYDYIDQGISASMIRLKSKATMKFAGFVRKTSDFTIELRNDTISKITIEQNDRKIEAVCV